MEETARQALIDVIGRFGQSVCDDPRRCKALLLDMCPQDGRGIRVLIGALQERVPQSLQGSSAGGVPLAVKIPQLATHLHRELALAEDAARWAVESWALALGLETPSQLASIATNWEATPYSSSGYPFEEAPPPGLGGSAPTPSSRPASPPPAPPRKQTSGRRSFLFGLILLAFCAAGYVGWQKYEDTLSRPPIEPYQDPEIPKLAFDLVENAVSIAAEFGRNHYRWRDRVENMLPRAQRAAKISTQGQAEYVDLLRNTQDYERLVAGNFDSYVRSVRRIAEYGPRYAEDAIKRAKQQQRLPIEEEALLLIAQHVQDALQARVDPDRWRQQLVDRLARREKVFS